MITEYSAVVNWGLWGHSQLGYVRNINWLVTFWCRSLRLDVPKVKTGWWLVMTWSNTPWTKGTAIHCVWIHVRGHEGKHTREKMAAGGQGAGWQSGKMAVSDRGAGWQSRAQRQMLVARTGTMPGGPNCREFPGGSQDHR